MYSKDGPTDGARQIRHLRVSSMPRPASATRNVPLWSLNNSGSPTAALTMSFVPRASCAYLTSANPRGTGSSKQRRLAMTPTEPLSSNSSPRTSPAQGRLSSNSQPLETPTLRAPSSWWERPAPRIGRRSADRAPLSSLRWSGTQPGTARPASSGLRGCSLPPRPCPRRVSHK